MHPCYVLHRTHCKVSPYILATDVQSLKLDVSKTERYEARSVVFRSVNFSAAWSRTSQRIHTVSAIKNSRAMYKHKHTVPWPRSSASDLWPQRTEFDVKSVHVTFMTKWQWDGSYCEGFSFPLSVSFHQCSIGVFIYMLILPEGQRSEAWETTEKATLFRKS
jgi:hypothetical protein